MESKNEFRPYFAKYLPKLAGSQIDQLSKYLALMLKWNRAYNLTSIVNPEEMVVKHIVDSLAVMPYFDGQNIVDVGTGAGLPGIPLAICCPEKQFTLLDSNGKKIDFLRQTLLEIGIENAKLCKERAENYKPEKLFDLAISRAFSSIKEFLDKSKHLVHQKGQFLCMKGKYPKDELNQMDKTFKIAWVRQLDVPGLTRHLVCIKYRGTVPIRERSPRNT